MTNVNVFGDGGEFDQSAVVPDGAFIHQVLIHAGCGCRSAHSTGPPFSQASWPVCSSGSNAAVFSLIRASLRVTQNGSTS
jgi:hypothetical protein